MKTGRYGQESPTGLFQRSFHALPPIVTKGQLVQETV